MKLHIEELVVHGVAAGDGERLVSVIERELGSLLGADQLAAAGRVKLPGGVFEIPAGLGVDDIGRRVAQAIRASLRATGDVSPSPATPADSYHTQADPPYPGGEEKGE